MTNRKKFDNLPDEQGHFGIFGGRFVPETLMSALQELENTYAALKEDEEFQKNVSSLLSTYAGRPTALYSANNLTRHYGGAKIYLKREDLAHTGAHKINNALGQALVAKRMNKRRIIAETGAGQHGVATATVCAMLGLECVIYMGAEDARRQSINLFRMRLLGADVKTVDAGSQTLKDAINEAIRDWVTNVSTSHYLLGSVVGPHPYPMMVRDFQSVIGKEARSQMLQSDSALPDFVVACVGGGSNAIGIFYPFLDDKEVKLVGVEAGGKGLSTTSHSASLSAGKPGVLHGSMSLLLQDNNGQVQNAHSIAPGLDYPGVGPEHSYLKSQNRAEYVTVTDKEALNGFHMLSETEGIIPALESAHAIYYGGNLAATLSEKQRVLICLSGRGDKDISIVANEQP